MKFLFDVFPLLLFFAAFLLYDIYVATAVAIAASFVQVSLYWIRHRRFHRLHLVSLALVAAMGGLTIVLHDKAFIMWKPTAIHWLFAAIFLTSQFVGKKPMAQRMLDLLGEQIPLPARAWKHLNASWVALFLVAGTANVYFVREYQDAEAALRAAAPAISAQTIDKFDCEPNFTGTTLELCKTAAHKERLWAYFKVPGTIALMLLFAIGQAVYLTRWLSSAGPANPADRTGSP